MTATQTIPPLSGVGIGPGVYLYGFTLGVHTKSQEASLLLPTGQWLEIDELAALFAPVRLEEYCPDHLQDPDWLVPRALEHEEVLEALMAQGPVLPVRFGCLFSSADKLGEFMRAQGEIIRQFLLDFADKEEWALKVYLDLEKAEAWLAAADPELAERQRRLPATPGARYFQEKQWRADVHKKARQWGRELARQLEAELGLEQTTVRPLKPRGPEESKGDMILHQAVLLPGAAVQEFRRRVAELTAERIEKGVALEISGPWPPYHFCPAFLESGP